MNTWKKRYLTILAGQHLPAYQRNFADGNHLLSDRKN